MKKIKKILLFLFLLVLTIVLVGTFYIRFFFANETIEELFFYATNGAKNADISVYLTAVGITLPFLIICLFALWALYNNVLINKTISADITFLKKKKLKFQVYPIKIIMNHKIIFSIILTIFVGAIAFYNLDGLNFAKNNLTESKFIEMNYANPKDTKINFKKHNNLILIFVESLETTLFTKEQGGDWDYEVIPEMYDLLLDDDSIYFASDNKVSGMNNLYSTTWTTGSIVSNTSGLPFKIPISANDYHSSNFLQGAYSLGDVLKDNGYYNELISAARTSFGGIKEYYTKHGKYKIIDSDNLRKYGFKYNDYTRSYWGVNDKYLFEMAKERLSKISKNTKFNLNLITIDTHANDEYIGNYSVKKFKTKNENAYATTSKLIFEFVNWVKEQPFYKDTTIVIIGDHPSMNKSAFEGHEYYKRRRYNVIINPVVTTNHTKNRTFTAVDMYPTILASIGAEIDEDQLALGVNLFSDKKTLSEKYGLDFMNSELTKKSLFYDDKILGSDYGKLILSNKNKSEDNNRNDK